MRIGDTQSVTRVCIFARTMKSLQQKFPDQLCFRIGLKQERSYSCMAQDSQGRKAQNFQNICIFSPSENCDHISHSEAPTAFWCRLILGMCAHLISLNNILRQVRYVGSKFVHPNSRLHNNYCNVLSINWTRLFFICDLWYCLEFQKTDIPLWSRIGHNVSNNLDDVLLPVTYVDTLV